jgi:hypothetical protein
VPVPKGQSHRAGEAFDTVSVKWVRHSAKIKSLKERLLSTAFQNYANVLTYAMREKT